MKTSLETNTTKSFKVSSIETISVSYIVLDDTENCPAVRIYFRSDRFESPTVALSLSLTSGVVNVQTNCNIEYFDLDSNKTVLKLARKLHKAIWESEYCTIEYRMSLIEFAFKILGVRENEKFQINAVGDLIGRCNVIQMQQATKTLFSRKSA